MNLLSEKTKLGQVWMVAFKAPPSRLNVEKMFLQIQSTQELKEEWAEKKNDIQTNLSMGLARLSKSIKTLRVFRSKFCHTDGGRMKSYELF